MTGPPDYLLLCLVTLD